MEQFIYYLEVSLLSIKRAPLPYALTVFILSVGLGVFFAGEKLVHFGLEEFAVLGVHHVQPAFGAG